MKQFGRRWKVEITHPDGSFDVELLRVAFDIDKTINEKPNPAQIQIWNLNRSHINQLLSQPSGKLTLSVGYGALHKIYSGDIVKVRVAREGLDFILTVECADGYHDFTQSHSAMTLKAGATDEEIVKALKKTMKGCALGATRFPKDRALPRGRVLSGDSQRLLNDIAHRHNANWSIQDGNFIFLPKDNVLNDEAVLLSQETGMINSPEQTDDGLELTCLLNPALQIGGLVEVKSILEYFNGQYKIIKLSHCGDGLGGDWLSTLTVVGGKFQKIEKEHKGKKEKEKA